MAERPIGALIKGITGDVKTHVQDEAQLAKKELVPAAKSAGIGAGLFGAAGYFGINAATLLYVAAALGIAALGLPLWLSFLIVAVVLLIIAGICALVGRAQVKKVKPPKRTIDQATQSVAAIKDAVQRANAAANAPQTDATLEGPVAARRALP
ncbi:MAG: phage holin family protein [Actinomycetes bacterium]